MSEVTVELPENSRVVDLRQAVDDIEYAYGRQTLLKSVKIVVKPVELKAEETPEQSAKRAAKQQEVGGVAPLGIVYKEDEKPVHKPVKV